jgi:hypothetical protein
MQASATIARRLAVSIGETHLRGRGRRAGVRALEACRLRAQECPLVAFDPVGHSRLWESMSMLREPPFSPRELQLLPWDLWVTPWPPTMRLVVTSGSWTGPGPHTITPAGEMIFEEGSGRRYVFGIDKLTFSEAASGPPCDLEPVGVEGVSPPHLDGLDGHRIEHGAEDAPLALKVELGPATA